MSLYIMLRAINDVLDSDENFQRMLREETKKFRERKVVEGKDKERMGDPLGNTVVMLHKFDGLLEMESADRIKDISQSFRDDKLSLQGLL